MSIVMMKKIVLIFCSLIFVYSCFIMKKSDINEKNEIKFKLVYEDEEYLGYMNFFYPNRLKLKLYENSGIKLVDLSLFDDSILINYCISRKINDVLKSDFYIYNNEINLYHLLSDVFKGISIKKNSIKDYNYSYKFYENEKFNYEIHSLKDNLSISFNTDNYRLLDSVILFNNADIIFNNKFQIKFLSISE
jgi:hypothetical protein